MRRRHAALFTLFLLVGLLAVPVVLTWWQVRQEQLNQALIAAVRRNDTRTVIVLLEQRANPNAQDYPPAADSFWLTFLERLRGHHPEKDKAPTALLVALWWRKDASGATVLRPPHNLALVRALVEHGANVNASEAFGTPLLMAASQGQRDVVRYLIAHGANVNAKDDRGNTPLSWVATWHDVMPGDADIINALLDHGAHVNGAYYLGTTPLMFALQTGNPATVRLLVARHADVKRKDRHGVSALSLAQNGSDKAIVELLKRAGAK